MSNNNFSNFFSAFQAQAQAPQNNVNSLQQQQQQGAQQQQQPGGPMFGGSNAANGVGAGSFPNAVQGLPPGMSPDMLRALMQSWQAGQTGAMQPQQQMQQTQQQHMQAPPAQHQQPQAQQTQANNFMAASMAQGFRPNNNMMGQGGMMGGQGMMGQNTAGPSNFTQVQQAGNISGAQAAAAASQAAALTRQQLQQPSVPQQQQQQQQLGVRPQAQGMMPNNAAKPAGLPANLTQAFEMARLGTLTPNQTTSLRAFLETHRNNPNLNPQVAAALLQQAQQGQGQGQGLPQQQAQQQQQQPRPPFPQQMLEQAALLQQQQQQQQGRPQAAVAMGQQQQAQGQPPNMQQPGVVNPARPATGATPMQIFKALESRIADQEAKLDTVTDANQRAVFEKQIADAKRMKEAITARFAQQLQQGQQQSPQTMQQRPPVPQQATPQMQARPSPRPGNANVFNNPSFAQQQQPQQFATLNQSPHLGAIELQQQQQQSQALQAAQQAAGQATARPPGVLTLQPEQFMRAVTEHMTQRNLPFQPSPMINNQRVDLYRFFQAVQAQGGSEAVTRKSMWPTIVSQLDLCASNDARYFDVARELEIAFRAQLAPFEESFQKAARYHYQLAEQQAASRQQQLGQQAHQQQTPQQQNSMVTAMRPLNGQQQQAAAQVSFGRPVQPGDQQQQQAMAQQQQPRPPGMGPGAFTINLNGRPVTLGAAPILPPEKLAEMNTTQDKFAAAYRQQQMVQLQQQVQLAKQQQQQQQQQGQGQPQPQAQQQQAPTFPPGLAQNMQMMGSMAQQQAQQAQQQSFPTFPGQQQQQQQQQQMQQLQQQGQAAANAAAAMGRPNNPPAFPPQPLQGGAQPIPGQPPQGANAAGAQQPRFIPVSQKQLEEARAVMARIDEELSRTRPRLTLNTTMPDAEREEVLSEVSKLNWVLDTVNALLPVFYAMQNNLEPAKRLKIMAYMFRDQLDLLPSRQCILRKADLDKLKMQMSRCIHYVRTSNPTISNFVIEEYKKEKEAERLRSMQQQQQQAMQQQQQHFLLQQQFQQQQQAQNESMGGDDGAPGSTNIKRSLRVEDLKPPPQKKGKPAAAGPGGQGRTDASPSAANASPKTGADTSPNAAGTTRGRRGTNAAATARNKKRASMQRPGTQDSATTPAADAKTPGSTSGRGRGGKQADATPGDSKMDFSPAANGQTPARANDALAEQSWAAMVAESSNATKDPATFVEAAWQDLFNVNGSQEQQQHLSANGGSTMALPTDTKTLESLLSMLGQQSTLTSGMPSTGSMMLNGQTDMGGNAAQQSDAIPIPNALEQADSQVDINLLDFIDADALGPDSTATVEDPQTELENLLATSHSSSASVLGDTPELVDSSRASSSTTSSSLNKCLANAAGLDMSSWTNGSPNGVGGGVAGAEGETAGATVGSSAGTASAAAAAAAAASSTSPVNDALSKLTGLGSAAVAMDSSPDTDANGNDKKTKGGEGDDWWDKQFEDISQQADGPNSRPWAILS